MRGYIIKFGVPFSPMVGYIGRHVIMWRARVRVAPSKNEVTCRTSVHPETGQLLLYYNRDRPAGAFAYRIFANMALPEGMLLKSAPSGLTTRAST